jgi:hypothetical protein
MGGSGERESGGVEAGAGRTGGVLKMVGVPLRARGEGVAREGWWYV